MTPRYGADAGAARTAFRGAGEISVVGAYLDGDVPRLIEVGQVFAGAIDPPPLFRPRRGTAIDETQHDAQRSRHRAAPTPLHDGDRRMNPARREAEARDRVTRYGHNVRRAKRVLLVFAALFGAALVGSLSDVRIPLVQVTPGPLPPVPTFIVKRPATVEVTASDDAGAPLAGARVQVFTLIADRAYIAGTGRTGATGRTTLSALPAGETWILAELDGFARVSTHLVLEAGTRAVKLVLARELTLHVAVADDGGAPLAAASLEVDTGDPLPLAVPTDANGEGTLRGLGPPPWELRVAAPGYETAREAVKAAPAETLRVTLRRLGALDITALGPARQPLEGALVMAVGSGLWPARSISTDAEGHARILDLPRGFYDLRAVQGDLVSRVEVGVSLGRGETKAVTLRLGLGRRVAVRVRDGDGDGARPVADANIVLAEGGLSSFPLESKTDARGETTLGPIAPGKAYVFAQASGFVAKSGLEVPDGSDPVVSVALVRGGVLSGDVVDARGFAVAGATIEIVGTGENGEPIAESSERFAFRAAHFSLSLGRGEAPPGEPPNGGDPARERPPLGELGVTRGPIPPIPRVPAPIAPTLAGTAASPLPAPAAHLFWPPASGDVPDPWVTGRNGTFRASPIAPGRLRAIAHHPAFLEATSELVTVTASGEARVHIVLFAGATLEGRVLDDRRMPVSFARVQLVASDGSAERSMSTARDGTFAFARVPSDVVLLVGLPDEVGEVALRAPISLEEGQRKDVELVLPKVRDPLAVRVTGERGDPLEGAEILLISLAAESPLRRTSFTDRAGQATFPHAAGLPVRLTVTHRGYAPAVQQVENAPGELVVAIGAGVSVTGSVTTARGRQPLDATDITLYAGSGSLRARTDRDGVYRFDDVAPGAAKLFASREGYVKTELAVSIAPAGRADRPVAIDPIDLEPAGTIVGEVVDAHGEPVAGARVALGSVAAAMNPAQGAAVTNARGQFRLDGVAEGEVTLEAAALDRGRGRADAIRVSGGETTAGVRIALTPD
jgi:hypothetical protein